MLAASRATLETGSWSCKDLGWRQILVDSATKDQDAWGSAGKVRQSGGERIDGPLQGVPVSAEPSSASPDGGERRPPEVAHSPACDGITAHDDSTIEDRARVETASRNEFRPGAATGKKRLAAGAGVP
jgi:hypothetical protein